MSQIMTIAFTEGKSTITVPITKRPREGSKAKGSELFQRGFLGGIEVDLAAIPQQVLVNLALEALEAKLQAPLKRTSFDKSKATQKQCQDEMRAALASLIEGGTKRKATGQSLTTRIRAEARKMLKEALVQLNEASDEPEELDTKALTETVSEYFKSYDTWAKPKASEALKAQLEPAASIVATFLKAAEERLEQQSKVGGLLAALKAKGPTAQGSSPPARPTPTQAETQRRKKGAAAQGRSA